MMIPPTVGRAACADNLPLVDRAFDKPGGPAAATLKARYRGSCEISEQCLLEGARAGRFEFGVWGGTSPNWRTGHGGTKSPAYAKRSAT